MEEEIQANLSRYLPLSLGSGRTVVVVNDRSSLDRFQKSLDEHFFAEPTRSTNIRCIGVDAEWTGLVPYAQRQNQMGKSSSNCSVLQIALHNEVFIIDFSALSPYRLPQKPKKKDASLPELSKSILERLFRDGTVIKIGWDFNTADLGMLRGAARGYFASCFDSIEGLLDLQKVVSVYSQQNEIDSKEKRLLSLSGCSGYFLGRPLSKNEQMSNWDHRPLKPEQIEYAALDAHVLLVLLDAILISIGSDESTGALAFYPAEISAHVQTLSSSTKKSTGGHDTVSAGLDALQLEDVILDDSKQTGSAEGSKVVDDESSLGSIADEEVKKESGAGGQLTRDSWRNFMSSVK